MWMETASELSRQDLPYSTISLAAIIQMTRVDIIKWLPRHGYIDREAAEMMRSWPHSGGFSVDGSVCLPDWDRAGLERLARDCPRPAFSVERLDRWTGIPGCIA